jgi:Fe(II)/alpha-ketoglutarate-dependent arginine beta-hydroxylase
MTTTASLVEYKLSPAEAEEIHTLARSLRDAGEDPATPDFYDRRWPAAERLPAGLRRFLQRFRHEGIAAACLIHGFPVDEAHLPPTPGHWQDAAADRSTVPQELYLALCGMVLGEPFSWATLQSGRLIQDILPIRGDEARQNAHSSGTLLEFHTEDGFHPGRCDYLLLFGLRNRDKVPTTVAALRDVELDDADRRLLSQPLYHITPDDEHLRQLEAHGGTGHPALLRMREMQRQPEPVAVLFGDPTDPYLRLDRPFMHCVGDDPKAQAALDRLVARLTDSRQDVPVETGSLLLVDNYRAVHGRMPFPVRYDGTDRWLKKLIVSRDLRKNATSYATTSHRVLF